MQYPRSSVDTPGQRTVMLWIEAELWSSTSCMPSTVFIIIIMLLLVSPSLLMFITAAFLDVLPLFPPLHK